MFDPPRLPVGAVMLAEGFGANVECVHLVGTMFDRDDGRIVVDSRVNELHEIFELEKELKVRPTPMLAAEQIPTELHEIRGTLGSIARALRPTHIARPGGGLLKSA